MLRQNLLRGGSENVRQSRSVGRLKAGSWLPLLATLDLIALRVFRHGRSGEREAVVVTFFWRMAMLVFEIGGLDVGACPPSNRERKRSSDIGCSLGKHR